MRSWVERLRWARLRRRLFVTKNNRRSPRCPGVCCSSTASGVRQRRPYMAIQLVEKRIAQEHRRVAAALEEHEFLVRRPQLIHVVPDLVVHRHQVLRTLKTEHRHFEVEAQPPRIEVDERLTYRVVSRRR